MYCSDGHLCKQVPLQVAEFYMESSRMTNIFRGFLLTEMHIVKHPPSPSAENPHENGGSRVGSSPFVPPSTDQNFFNFMGVFKKCIRYVGLALSWSWLPLIRQVQDPHLNLVQDHDPPLNLEQVFNEDTFVVIKCHENKRPKVPYPCILV